MGSSGSSTTTQTTSLPGWLRPIYQGAVGQELAAQGGLPSILEMYGMVPGLQVPNLTPEQTSIINLLEQYPTGLNAPEQGAMSQIQQLTSGPIGSSPTTQAAEQAFKDFTLPVIQNQAAAAGQGNSGAALEAMSRGSEQALVPFLQQEVGNREAAVGQLGQLGGQQYGQDMGTLTTALQSAGLPYEVAVQQAQALFNQLQQRFNFGQQVQMGPLQQVGQLFGKGSSVTTSNAPKFRRRESDFDRGHTSLSCGQGNRVHLRIGSRQWTILSSY